MTIENRWPSVPGETPIDDISGLLVKGVTARRELNHLEAENIANIWLRLKGERSTEWPEPELGDASSIRIEYIQAIQAADRLDYQPLIELHRTFAPR